MSPAESVRAPTLAPFQQRFVDDFVAAFQPGYACYLQAPPGSGKSHAAAAAVARLLRERRATHVLQVVRGHALAEQWGYVYGRQGQRAHVADMRTLRLLGEVPPAEEGEPEPAVLVVSESLARRADALDLLARRHWDLVVFDDCGGSTALRALHARIEASVPVPARLSLGHPAQAVEREDTPPGMVVDWSRAARDYFATMRPAPTAVTDEVRAYSRTPAERTVCDWVARFARHLPSVERAELLKAAASSMGALDVVLSRHAMEPPAAAAASLDLEGLLAVMDRAGPDSRLAAALEVLASRPSGPGGAALVFADLPATRRYLLTALADAGIDVTAVQPDASTEEVAADLERHRREGGVIVLGTHGSGGLPLGHVTTVLHYDLPMSAAEFAQREGRYRRFSRSQPGRSICLRDTSQALTLEQVQLQMVADHLSGRDAGRPDVSGLSGPDEGA